jgi:hypothetical protein
MAVYLAQLLCPARHTILALAEERGPLTEEQIKQENEGLAVLLWKMKGKLRLSLNPWCALCGAKEATWHVEVGRTKFQTKQEADRELSRLEQEQLDTQRTLVQRGRAFDSPEKN